MTSNADQGEDFCFAPFSQLLLSPTGKIHPCCYHFGYELGYAEQSLDTVWNGKPMRKLRREFLDGNPRICRSRMHNTACHKNFGHLAASAELSELQNQLPKRLDLRLNGQCNLSCVMCDVWQQPNGKYQDSLFWQDLSSEVIKNLIELDILGGEPFIQRDVYRLIQEVAAVNPGVRLSVITNAHYPHINKVIHHLDMLELKNLQVSLDACNSDTYFKVRGSKDFAMVMENARQFSKYCQNQELANFRLSLCALQQNWHEIPEFLLVCRELQAQPDIQYAFYDPSGKSSLSFLPVSQLETIRYQLLQAVAASDHHHLAGVIRPIEQKIKLRSKT